MTMDLDMTQKSMTWELRYVSRRGRRLALALGGLVVASALSGCATEAIDVTTASDKTREDNFGKPLIRDEEGPGSLLGDSFGFGTGSNNDTAGVQLPVNRYLWRATLDTLAFLPLASTDPYGGVIVTDWGSPADAPAERFKVSTFITSAELRPQSLRVVVNRQQRDPSGQWTVAPVSQDTGRQLENAILTRARQLKIEAGDQS